MPKKVKKGGGGKGWTEEERLASQQQRAKAEEEAAREREDLLTLFLKDKLQKEQRNTAVNALKVNDGWRTTLRQTRAAELRTDISILSQTFERQLDGACSTIKTLERNLQEAERQAAQERRAHLQHVHRLSTQQEKQVTSVQQQWESGLQRLSSRFSSEREQMLAHSQQRRADLDDAMFALEQKHKEMMNEIHRLYREGIALYESAQEDQRAALALGDKERLWEKTLENQQALQLYHQDCIELDALVSENQSYMEKKDQIMKEAKRLRDNIIQLQMKLNVRKTNSERAELYLTIARNQVNKSTQELRHRLARAQMAARTQLTDLTVQSAAATKRLQAAIDKGNRVLRIAEMCRTLEREQENMLTSSSTADNQRQEGSATEEEELEKETPEFPELQQVMRHINTALLHREALKRHRGDLSRENQQLRLLLRQHLDAMTVSNSDLDTHHALLTVYQAPIRMAPLDADRHHTIIEAVHVIQHSL
uniref:dynein regulatory complex subunit 2 n=1 Tax=Monopterus albus TaxID=43700 RepID=UPI0009B387F7|nr:coiled-coil domain-containing protein 65 [Monopterus albus]XP_020441992.1 coiled-coil domain-containing protein 65 [Monopterus albus]XP_020441993.1 coiled-coil domain-containing protein 65 [Monopterus albus]XP_020441994.1 coiled-coil domain-containing protein 65 [Monopterus albus]